MAQIETDDAPYEIPDQPTYNPTIRALKTSDRANAKTVINPVIQRIIENVHAVKLSDDGKANLTFDNVSGEAFSAFLEQAGIVGADGNVAARDLSNVSLEDFKRFVEAVGLTGANGSVAAKQIVSHVTLPAAGWQGSAAPYAQSVQVAGVTAKSLLLVSPAAEEVNCKAVSDASVLATAQAEGLVAFSAEKKPTAAIVFIIVNAGDV